jgi:hypothetical protein
LPSSSPPGFPCWAPMAVVAHSSDPTRIAEAGLSRVLKVCANPCPDRLEPFAVVAHSLVFITCLLVVDCVIRDPPEDADRGFLR